MGRSAMECRYCGKPADDAVDGVPICEGCYQQAGSCCLEFGGDDLWQDRGDLTGEEPAGP
jgi:hypothetical protein